MRSSSISPNSSSSKSASSPKELFVAKTKSKYL